MLLSRQEMTFSFGDARFDPAADRDLLAFVMNQFLYGEVTGIQVGHWLYAAPSVGAAKFLARQAVEELQHVDSFLRILRLLDARPAPPHRIVRWLATGMMPHKWEEHVGLEMATGEGFVLTTFYALIDTINHDEIKQILLRAAKQEERHVSFGETETARLIGERPSLRKPLLGLALVWMWGVRRLSGSLATRLPDHPVLRSLPQFLEHALACTELRLQRIGVLEGSLSSLGIWQRLGLVARAYAWKGAALLGRLLRWPLGLFGLGRQKRLTDTYLADPHLNAQLTGPSVGDRAETSPPPQ